MDVFALTMRLKEDGAGAVKASVDKLRDSMNTATTGATKLDNGMKAVSSAMKTLGVAVSIGTAFQKFIDATSEAQFAQAQLKSALGSTGYAAGQSRDALNDHAAALQKVTAFGDDAINGAQALLLTFTKIRGDVFPKATAAVLDMAQAMGMDLKSAALSVGKALNDPIAGFGALGRVGVQFSDEQKKLITSFVETGNVAKAQAVILKELETQFAGSAQAARNTLGGALAALKVAFEDLFEASEESTGGIVQGINNITNALISLNQWLTKTQAFTKVFNQIAQSFQVFMAPFMVFKALTSDAASAAKSVNKLNEYLAQFAKNTQLFGQKGSQSSENALQEVTVGKSRVALLVELGAVARLSSTELGTLRTAEANLLTQLNAGNLGLEKRIELQKTLVDVQKVTQEQLALNMSKAPTVANPTARQEITGGPAKITAVSPQVIAQVKENFATMNAAIDEQAESTLDNLRTGFAAQLGGTFADALGAGFEAAFATGSISEGFKAFGSAMLSGLGGMLQSFGKQALLASTLMAKLMESFGSLNPYVAVAASIALIALGGALKGAASSAFGGGGQSANVSTMGGGYGGSMRSSAQTLPTLTYGPTSAASGSAIRPASAMNVTIIGPNDPSAQRAMQELMTKADRRGNV